MGLLEQCHSFQKHCIGKASTLKNTLLIKINEGVIQLTLRGLHNDVP